MRIEKRTARAFLLLLLPVIMIIAFWGCEAEGEETTAEKILNPAVGMRGGVLIGGERVDTIEPERKSATYLALDAVGKKLYDAAYTAVSMDEYAFEITGVTLHDYCMLSGQVMQIFFMDHPEYFWLSGASEYSSYRMSNGEIGNITVYLGVHEYWETHDLAPAISDLDRVLSSVVSQARAIEGDYERVLFVHDYIIGNASYDYVAYELDEEMGDEAEARVSSAYGALVSGSTMCAGYTAAFNLIMNELGYESYYVPGVANDGPHAWNLINLGGNYYHVDLTWDDLDGEPGKLIYDYFCLTDEQISLTHTVDAGYYYPPANASEYNYFVREGLVLTEYSEQAFSELLKKYDGGDFFAFRCENEETYKKVIYELIELDKFFNFEAFAGVDSYYYLTNEDAYTLYCFFE